MFKPVIHFNYLFDHRNELNIGEFHGVLFRGASEGKIRQKTIEENLLEAVIGLPANLFFGTGIPAEKIKRTLWDIAEAKMTNPINKTQ